MSNRNKAPACRNKTHPHDFGPTQRKRSVRKVTVNAENFAKNAKVSQCVRVRVKHA